MNYEFVKKILFKFDPEIAHKIAEFGLRSLDFIPGGSNFLGHNYIYKQENLKQKIFDLEFKNPVGIAGGFDKNATMARAIAGLGFGFYEFGTFTPKPQFGNDKPRLFRLINEQSLQNSMGFNNDGSDKIFQNVRKFYPFVLPVFANIGKNKITSNEEAIKDYKFLIEKFNNLCDIFVINLSSPNTPNLRNLQNSKFLEELFKEITTVTQNKILLKIAPDMNETEAIEISKKAVECGASGIIINNTSTDYSLCKDAKNFGGISGELIKQKSRKIFKSVADELFGETILISCGGISEAKDAYERILMGANLIEIFTSFIYKGPSICKNLNFQISEFLKRDGFSCISEAVGAKKGEKFDS